jgi:XTP/dITP diphosphohydrolase
VRIAPGLSELPVLVVATGNVDKVEELAAALPGFQLEVIGSMVGAPDETGSTYYENARLKARFGRRSAPIDAWAVGEDSGIEVVALDGRPGIHSARWAGDGIARILEELEGVEERGARYVCSVVAHSADGLEIRAEGVLEGSIALGMRGDGGFGYDPIFVPGAEQRTVAELGNAWKRTNSHRARAAFSLAEQFGALSHPRPTP